MIMLGTTLVFFSLGGWLLVFTLLRLRARSTPAQARRSRAAAVSHAKDRKDGRGE